MVAGHLVRPYPQNCQQFLPSPALYAVCPRPKMFPCGRRKRVKEAEDPFLGDGSSMPFCLPERKTAPWAQGLPSTSHPVPCLPAPFYPMPKPLPPSRWPSQNLTGVTVVTTAPSHSFSSKTYGGKQPWLIPRVWWLPAPIRSTGCPVLHGKKEIGFPEPKRW